MILDVDIKIDLKRFALASAFSATNGSYGILGASGCGKSMTLKSIAGIVTPDTGSITVKYDDSERVLFDRSRRINVKPQKRRVGYLFQNYALFPNMTVAENILIGVSENKPEVLERMIKMFHLEGMEKSYPKTLSGGQQQRVALARMLAYNPDILLLDEPFSAMDTFLREGLRLEMLELLKSYKGVSIMVSHDRDEVYQLCDNIILMDDGRIIQTGDKRDVFENPRTVKAARLTGCKNISRIEPIDAHSFRASDWGDIVLHCERAISASIKYAGIRAHDFTALTELKGGANEVSCENSSVSEMPFEWYVTLKNGIWWKKEKNRQDSDLTFTMPKGLYVPPEKIILLEAD